MTAMTVSPSTWPRPRGLLLDAMGTLIGLRRSVGHTYAAMAAEHGLSVAADAIDQAFPGILRQAPALAFPGLDSDSLLQAERHWWGAHRRRPGGGRRGGGPGGAA